MFLSRSKMIIVGFIMGVMIGWGSLSQVSRVYAELIVFTPGAYVINLGTTPQTASNALKPYGMVYDILNEKVPINWAIADNKTSDADIDFSADGISYRSSAFII